MIMSVIFCHIVSGGRDSPRVEKVMVASSNKEEITSRPILFVTDCSKWRKLTGIRDVEGTVAAEDCGSESVA